MHFYIPPVRDRTLEGVIKRYQADFHSEALIRQACGSADHGFSSLFDPSGNFHGHW